MDYQLARPDPAPETSAHLENDSGVARILALLGKFDQEILQADLDHVLARALDFVANLVRSPRVSVTLIDETRGGVTVLAHSGDPAGLSAGQHVPIDASALSIAIKDGVSLYRPDLANAAQQFLLDRTLLAEGIQSTMIVPLRAEDRIFGTLNVGATAVDGIDPDQRQLIELIAPRLAAAVRNAQLFEAVRHSEERIQALLEHSDDIIVVAGAMGVPKWVSPNLERVRGIKPDDYVGRSGFDIVHPDDASELQEAFQWVNQHPGEVKSATYRIADGAGDWRVYEAKACNWLHDPHVRGIVINTRDITERRRLEEHNQQREKLESLGLLAGGLAHDFNNLLTAIHGGIELADRALPDGHEATRWLDHAGRALRNAQHVTGQLLAFARGGAPIKRALVLEELVREAVHLTTRGTKIACVIDAGPGLWPVEVDEAQISQVFHNLMLNAVQAMPSGGEVHIRMENVGTAAGVDRRAAVRVTVLDQGPGMSSDVLEHIFDPYYTTKPNGTGLGLSTAYAVLSRHDGTIRAFSTPGEGARFEVELPARPGARIQTEANRPTEHRGQGKALVMDDEEGVREVLTEMLAELGYMPTSVNDGGAAVHAYEAALQTSEPYELVILDLTVAGGMGGQEAIARIRELGGTCKAVVSSGYSSDAVMSRHDEHGFDGVLRKPYTFAELAELLERI